VQDFDGAQLQNELLDKRVQTRVFEGPQLATVVASTPTTVTFTIPDYDKQAKFGPAPYPRPALHQISLTGGVTPNPHQHDPGLPPRGTTCLVVFVGPGVDRPYVVAFYGWPSS
jgi:hypothetical protein